MKDDPMIHVRVPKPLLDRVRVEAVLNGRSVNAEVVYRLAHAYGQTLPAPPLKLKPYKG